MQEMALQAVLRDELYVEPAGPERGRQQQVGGHYHALEALGQAALAPARPHLPAAKARVLGITDEVMAGIGLAVQEEAAEAAIRAGAIDL